MLQKYLQFNDIRVGNPFLTITTRRRMLNAVVCCDTNRKRTPSFKICLRSLGFDLQLQCSKGSQVFNLNFGKTSFTELIAYICNV